MKKLAIAALLLIFSSMAWAAPFAPEPLTIAVQNEILYACDGSTIDIPVTLNKAAKVVFMVYTLGKGEQIGTVQNGYLGWHYVNKIDTCLYVSTPTNLGIGAGTISWTGRDSHGTVLTSDRYTYYIWGYDNVTPRTKATTSSIYIDRHHAQPLEYNEDGSPTYPPRIWWMQNWAPTSAKWTLGDDVENNALLETCDTVYFNNGTGGFFNPRLQMPWAMNRHDFSTCYRCMVYSGSYKTIEKFQWVVNGTYLPDPSWAGASLQFSDVPYNRAGATINIPGQDLIYFNGWASGQTVPASNSWIIDYDGNLLATFANEWYIPTDLFNQGLVTSLSAGPDEADSKNGHFVLGDWNCPMVAFNPETFLTTNDYASMNLWENGNGDFYYDANWTGDNPTWICFGDVYPCATRSIYISKLGFVSRGLSGSHGISGLLMGPDGTGIIQYTWADEVAEVDVNNEGQGVFFVDNGSAFDGAYTDFSDTAYAYNAIWYQAMTTVQGLIGQVGVADAAPSAFAVAQNSPNPFNPTTTINYTIPQSGHVTVDVFNVAGQKVASLVNGQMSAGSHSVVWNAANFANGVYFYTVKSGNLSKTMKMTLLK